MIEDYHDRRRREPETVICPSARGDRIDVLAVEERVLEDGVRVMKLLAAPARGYRKGDRVYVNRDKLITQHADACKVCTARVGEFHAAWCPRRGEAARKVSSRDSGLLRGWS